MWWSRHIDFHTSCLLCRFVKTNFEDVSANSRVCNFHFFRNTELYSLPWVPLVRNVELSHDSPLHPGSWARGLQIPFSEPGSGALLFSHILFSNLANLGSWSSRGLLGGPWPCPGCLGCLGLPGALLGLPWGCPGAVSLLPWLSFGFGFGVPPRPIGGLGLGRVGGWVPWLIEVVGFTFLV